MGDTIFDKYSLLHFGSGAVARALGIRLLWWMIAHITFEFVENTEGGMKFINENLTWGPGGKPRADEFINIVGDNASAMLGWWVAMKLDDEGKRKKWYVD